MTKRKHDNNDDVQNVDVFVEHVKRAIISSPSPSSSSSSSSSPSPSSSIVLDGGVVPTKQDFIILDPPVKKKKLPYVLPAFHYTDRGKREIDSVRKQLSVGRGDDDDNDCSSSSSSYSSSSSSSLSEKDSGRITSQRAWIKSSAPDCSFAELLYVVSREIGV